MDGLYNGAGTTLFSDLEQGAIKKTTLTGESMHDSSTPSVQAHLFPLSLSEAWSIEKSQWKAQEITDPEGKGQGWWIRTSNVDNLANFMYSMYYSNTYIHVSKAVRPAFNLNLDAVLFTSAAVGGKNGTNIGLKKVDDNNGNEWKLTLKDSSRQFAVTETTASCKPGDTITLNYTGATIKTDDAPNEYISAMIADSSGVQYYGKIAQPTNEAGEIRITIPFSLTAGTYTLYVFSEQCNGDERTDYASDLKGIPLTVNNTPRPSDGDTPAIILGTSSLGTGDIVYFGTYGATDVPWYMLNNYGFMLSKYTLGTSDFRGNSSYYGPQAANGYYNYSTSSNEVISSVLKKTMDGLYNGTDTTLFSDLEQGAIKETTLTKESMYADDDRVTDVNAHLFPLSKAEAEVLDSEVRQARSIADPKGEARWWLRSSYSEGSAYFVSAGGGIDHVPLAIIALGVRPAFNLDMNSVLFASAAVDGKADTTVDGNLTEVSAYSDPEWKLTLRDSSRNEFTSSTTARSGNTLTVRYENAATGNNEYISAIVRDANGNVSYYGRIAPLDGTTNGANGTVSITLPDSFDKNTDTLYVFNEQYNGDKMTDYSSDFCTVDSSAPVTTCDVEINSTNFPDAAFRAYVSENFDTDEDGILTSEEIAAVTEIDCSDGGIESLQGIEHFTALTKLICNGNYLTSLDISSNTALKHLECGKTWLTNLDVSSNTALEYLDCGSNYLTSLDVSKNDKLQQLVCNTNNLTSLDVSKNNALQTLHCTSNTYDITLGDNRTFNLSSLPGNFDVNKASDWKGGTVNGNILTFNSDVVTYTYDCENEKTATFTLDARTKYAVTVNGGLYGELGMSGLPCGKDGIWGTYAEGETVMLFIGTRADSGYTLEGLEFDGIAKDDFIWTIPQDVEDIQRCGYFIMPAKDVAVTVKWKKNDDTPDTTYTITFDPNGGDLTGQTTTETEPDGTVDYLPRAARDGYTFDGWFTAAGEKVYTYVNVFTADTTVYAHWTPEAETKQITEASFALKGYTVGANAKDIVVTSNTEGLSLTAGYFEGLGKPYSYLLCEVVGEGPDDVVPVTGSLEAGKVYCLMLRADVETGYDVSGLTKDHVTLNGTNKAADYGENFDSTIGCMFELPILTADDTSPAKYTVTVNGSYASAAGTGEYEEGDLVTLAAGSRSGYTFSGWTSDDVIIPNTGSADTSFVMPAKAVTVTANWTYNGGNSSGGSGSGSGSSGSGSGSSSGSGSTGTDETPDGWVEEDGIWHYYDPEDGTMAEDGVQEIDGETYLFRDGGGMASDTWYQDEEGHWYYFGGSGAMVKDQWVLAKGVWYYLGSDGVMLTNQWVLSKGVWYFLGSDGAMVSNQWVLAKGVWYFLGPDGAMLTDQWVNWNGTWYYLDKNGAMLTSKWLYWKGAWYYLGESGAMLTGTVTPDGYRVDENGVWIA
ncbi:MAG: DUF6273 domain-containing protein [Oscillospiraceae bacterium]|nr:DUF6273 domain-containing protein [Oscillospiraceae bacterium]